MIGQNYVNIIPDWAKVLNKGNLSGGTNPTLSDGDRLEGESGSFIDTRANSTDGFMSLSDVLYINETLNTSRVVTNNTNGFVVGSTLANSFLRVDGSNGQTYVNILNSQNIKTEANQLKVLGSSITFFNNSELQGNTQALISRRSTFSGFNDGYTHIFDNSLGGITINPEDYHVAGFRYLGTEVASIKGDGTMTMTADNGDRVLVTPVFTGTVGGIKQYAFQIDEII